MVPCNYDRSTANLKTLGEQVTNEFNIIDLNGSFDQRGTSDSLSPTRSPLALLSTNPQHATILRFKQRTALTFGTPLTVHLYAEAVPRLAMQYEFLLHAVLATTFVHDRSLAGAADPMPVESYHFGQSAALLNQKLSTTIFMPDRDAIWATSIYLCAMAIFSVNTTDPSQAWPMKPHSHNNLEWIDLKAGLRVIWDLASMERHESIFAHSEKKAKVNCIYPDDLEPGIDGLPPLLVRLCGLGKNSTSANNSYHAAVGHLSWMLPMEGTPMNMLKFMDFAGAITPAFRALLQEKDPIALLLLALWYSKLWHCAWWMIPRAVVECRSICQYLTLQKIEDKYFTGILKELQNASLTLDDSVAETLLAQPLETFLQVDQHDGPSSMQVSMFWTEL